MPKNNNQVSPLDKLAAEMEAHETAKTQAAIQPEAKAQAEQVTVATETEQPKYVPADNEKNFYHLLLEKPLYDKTTGKKISTPYVQKFNDRAYKKFTEKKNGGLSNAEMLGYTVTVLWNPQENI